MAFIKKYPHYILLTILAIIGVFTAGSYGIAWDEPIQRDVGEICYNYVFHNNTFYFDYSVRDHGPAFELILLFIEKSLNLTVSRDIYVMRHLVTHLFFLVGALYLYKLIFLLYKKQSLAVIGLVFLLIHPSIYSHSFFNSKDIPFLTILIFFFYQFFLAFRDRTFYRFMLMGILCAFMISIRVVGVLFVGLSIGFIVLDVILNRKETGILKKQSLFMLLFLLSTLGATIAVWPLLWKHPLKEFMYVFESFSKIEWGGYILFKGQNTLDEKIGWDYIPTWFCINTPLAYVLCGLLGIILFLANRIKTLKTFRFTDIEKNTLLYVLSFFAPMLAVILLHSTVFDTWRHLFFIYPGFIMLAIYGLHRLCAFRYKPAIYGIILVSATSAGWVMLRHFPLQYVYFNEVITLHQEKDYIRNNYEMDYWGLGYKQSLEYILSIDTRSEIRVNGENYPARTNAMILPEDQQKRIIYVDYVDQADYYITNYRGHPEDYLDSNLKELTAFFVYGNKVNSVFKVLK